MCLERARDTGGPLPDLGAVPDPHVVATLLKLFLRELPQPLIPFQLYPHFIEAASCVLLRFCRRLLSLKYARSCAVDTAQSTRARASK